MNVVECKKKWKTIRAGYFTSMQKKTSGSSAGRKKGYTRDLSFLKKYSLPGER